MKFLPNISPLKQCLLLSASALLLCVFLYAWLRRGEPRYDGKSLSHWAATYAQELQSQQRVHVLLQASNAIYHIGPSAVPFALARIPAYSGVHDWTLPKIFQQPRFLRKLYKRNAKKRGSAIEGVYVFTILGERGRSAFPELRAMLFSTNRHAPLAAWALANLGETGLSALLEARTNALPSVRSAAIGGLSPYLYQTNQDLQVYLIMRTKRSSEKS